MGYEFRADETVPQSVLLCAREQLERALRALEHELEQDPVEAVHAARKAVKKQRALLRLVRGAIPGRQRRAVNAQLRDAARKLSGARDADVLIQTLDKLSEQFVGQLPEHTFAAAQEQLSQGAPGDGGRPEDFDQAREEFRQLMAGLDSWEFAADGWKALRTGLGRTYRAGRRAFREARRSPTMENLHQWRKRVKDLWYHLRLLAPVCGPTIRGQAEDADRLAELLGDDHDLALLREVLLQKAPALAVDLGALVALIDYQRDVLQSEAMSVGMRLYAEKPAAFERRLRRSWEAGCLEHKAFQERHPAVLAEATRAPQTLSES